jgi:hypothetical protein
MLWCWSCSCSLCLWAAESIACGPIHPSSCCVHAGTVRSSNKTSQQVILQFPQAVPVQPSVPVLRLQFSYKLQEGLDGFYRSSYIGECA